MELKYNKYFDKDKYGILDNSKKTPLITFPSLTQIPFIKHGFSTRLGGISKDHLTSLNLSFSRGDDPENVIENFKRICDSINVDYKNLVFTDQVHETIVLKVTKEDQGKGIIKDRTLKDVDGLITNDPNVVLTTFYADCVPLYFVDTKNKAIGLSHSGWRGTVKKMGAKTIEAMKEHFNTKPADLITVIGPSICKSCYEVSTDVFNAFKETYSKEQCEEIFTIKSNGAYNLDLWKANELQLIDAGLTMEQISVSGICTCCNSEILYSHRASEGKRGNLAAFLSIC